MRDTDVIWPETIEISVVVPPISIISTEWLGLNSSHNDMPAGIDSGRTVTFWFWKVHFGLLLRALSYLFALDVIHSILRILIVNSANGRVTTISTSWGGKPLIWSACCTATAFRRAIRESYVVSWQIVRINNIEWILLVINGIVEWFASTKSRTPTAFEAVRTNFNYFTFWSCSHSIFMLVEPSSI